MTVAEEILAHLPECVDLDAGEKMLAPLGPLEVVLIQESSRYNCLIKTMSESLSDVKRAVKGQIVMSVELEEIAMCLYNGRVPVLWLKGN